MTNVIFLKLLLTELEFAARECELTSG